MVISAPCLPMGNSVHPMVGGNNQKDIMQIAGIK